MMENAGRRLGLVQPVNYQIIVPGRLDESRSDWVEGMTVRIESKGKGAPFTILTGKLDQAALQGLLRRLYSLGLPLVSVICLECGLENNNCSCRNGKEEERE